MLLLMEFDVSDSDEDVLVCVCDDVDDDGLVCVCVDVCDVWVIDDGEEKDDDDDDDDDDARRDRDAREMMIVMV